MTHLAPGSPYLLIADSGLGVVWRLHTRSSQYEIVLDSPLMKPVPTPPILGINGIHIFKSFVYFTNSFQGIFARVPVHLSGPHAGSSQGQLVARRLPFALSSAAWVHSLAAMLFIGLVTGLVFAIWKSAAPAPLQLGIRRLVIIALIQATIGGVQYLTHLPPLLVELHVAGATSLAIGVTQFHLRQSAHDREPGTRRTT